MPRRCEFKLSAMVGQGFTPAEIKANSAVRAVPFILPPSDEGGGFLP